MSYRSDHDAALARVDALESELATLRRGQPPAPAPPRRSFAALAGVLALAGTIVAIGAAVSRSPRGTVAANPVLSPDVRSELRGCAGKEGLRLDATCRALIDGLATDIYVDPDVRAAVGAWSDADRELARVTDWDSDDARRAVLHHTTALQQVGSLL